MSREWFVIVNPGAGRAHEILDRASRALIATAVGHRIEESTAAEHVAELVEQGIGAGYRDFVAVGGDGTAHLVLNGLMAAGLEEAPTLAILPSGSGSDFIKTFALPSDMEGAALHLTTDDRYLSDVGLITGSFGRRYFLNAANIGLTAASVDRALRLPDWLGAIRYTAGFWLELPRFGKDDVVIKVDRHELASQLLTVVVANGQFFGGGLNIAPRASVQDGVFDVQCFAGPRRNALTVMPRVARGAHLTHRAVRRYVGKEIDIDVPPTWPVEADGELLGRGSVHISVVPGAIEFKI